MKAKFNLNGIPSLDTIERQAKTVNEEISKLRELVRDLVPIEIAFDAQISEEKESPPAATDGDLEKRLEERVNIITYLLRDVADKKRQSGELTTNKIRILNGLCPIDDPTASFAPFRQILPQSAGRDKPQHALERRLTMGKPAYPLPTRLDYLIGVYGECCRKSVAARILGLSGATISTMILDGRLSTVCGGKMIDMHSVAAYMDAPAQADFEARLRKRRGGTLPRHYVVLQPPQAGEAAGEGGIK